MMLQQANRAKLRYSHAGEPAAAFHAPKAVSLIHDSQQHIGTHSRRPHLAVKPSFKLKDLLDSPTVVVEAAYFVDCELHVRKALELWMSEETDTQVTVLLSLDTSRLLDQVAYSVL